MDIASVRRGYDEDKITPHEVVAAVLAKHDDADHAGIWIHCASRDQLLLQADEIVRRARAGAALPLFGVPFAVKDNIDVAGMPTTAACPGYSYQPQTSATVVQRLVDAGALVVGKTNLDQFATGLVGTRSPYGSPANPFDRRYIVGGSSSGSAAAVARGLVSFALGTDTAGSGRVPAAFTNTVGLKPSRGLLSTAGVVPACRSLDCVSVFGLTCDDAAQVATVAAAFDQRDAFSQPEADRAIWTAPAPPPGFVIGVPKPAEREFFGDKSAARAFEDAQARLSSMGAEVIEVDCSGLWEAAALLYDGPFVAERLSGLETFVREHPDLLLPVTLKILSSGFDYRGTQVFHGLHRLRALQAQAQRLFAPLHALMLPTTPTIYRVDEIAAEPIALNTRLGRYTNFVNLLDLSAVAVPNGLRPDGLPTGITFLSTWGKDARLLSLARAYHARVGGTVGATGQPLVQADAPVLATSTAAFTDLVVVGAHLSGEPLNGQLVALGAHFARACRTAPHYRLYALPGQSMPKPGLVRGEPGSGGPIEVEIWSLPTEALGRFFAGIAAPLGLGRVELEGGEWVAGFLCEAYAAHGAQDITVFGGWKAFLHR